MGRLKELKCRGCGRVLISYPSDSEFKGFMECPRCRCISWFNVNWKEEQ